MDISIDKNLEVFLSLGVLGGYLFASPIKPALRAPQLLLKKKKKKKWKKKEKEKEHHNFLSNHSNYTILLIIILFIFTFILFSFPMPTDYFYTTIYFLASLLKLWFISWLRLIIEFNSIIGPFYFYLYPYSVSQELWSFVLSVATSFLQVSSSNVIFTISNNCSTTNLTSLNFKFKVFL